jgi:hypothetical protein
MTDPKTAARTISGRLQERQIRIKHVQALDLVAAGCGFQDRSKLAGVARLPDMLSVNARLLASAAKLIARHDEVRRATIVEVTTDVLAPKAQTAPRDVRSRDGGPWVLAMEQTDPVDDVPTLFWNTEDGWVHFETASVFPDTGGTLPTAGMTVRQVSTMRWMNIDDAAFRSGVDDAVNKIDAEDPAPMEYPAIEGERPLDYDRIAAIMAGRRIFVRPLGAREIALRDGVQRASLYTASLSDDPDTEGGQVVAWVRDVNDAFRGGLAPSHDLQHDLILQGVDAINGIIGWIEPSDRLYAWLEACADPELLATDIAPDDTVTTQGGIDISPLTNALQGLKSQFSSLDDERDVAAQDALNDHDFGEDAVVGEMDGWERTIPGDEWTRTVYLESDQQNIDEGSTAVTLRVVFKTGTAELSEVYHSDDGGNLFHSFPRTARVRVAPEAYSSRKGLSVDLTAEQLGDPDAVPGAVMALIVEHVARNSGHCRWESSSSGLEQETIDSITTSAISGVRAAKDAAGRRHAVEKAIVSEVRTSDPFDDWIHNGHDEWSTVSQAIEEAAEEAGLADAYDEHAWQDQISELYQDHVRDEDDSKPADVVHSRDMTEIMFWLVPPGCTSEEMTYIAGPWPDAKRVVPDDTFRHALAKLGIDLDAWRAEVGTDEDDDMQGPSDAAPIPDGPLISIPDLVTIIENGCTQNFGLVLYAYVPLTDVLKLDLTRPFAFERARVALYNPYEGTFMDMAARKGRIVVQDGVDGRLEGLVGSSPKDFCGLAMDCYDTRLSDPELKDASKVATTTLDEMLSEQGLKRRFPGHAVDWIFDDGRTTLTATVGVDDAERRYQQRPVVAVLRQDGAPVIEIGEA